MCPCVCLSVCLCACLSTFSFFYLFFVSHLSSSPSFPPVSFSFFILLLPPFPFACLPFITTPSFSSSAFFPSLLHSFLLFIALFYLTLYVYFPIPVMLPHHYSFFPLSFPIPFSALFLIFLPSVYVSFPCLFLQVMQTKRGMSAAMLSSCHAAQLSSNNVCAPHLSSCCHCHI